MTMKHDSKKMYEQCKKHMHSYVLIETIEGARIDGIITGLDDEYVYMAVPIDAQTQMAEAPQDGGHDYRQFGPYGWYGPGFGYGPPRRFSRVILPLAALATLGLLAWY